MFHDQYTICFIQDLVVFKKMYRINLKSNLEPGFKSKIKWCYHIFSNNVQLYIDSFTIQNKKDLLLLHSIDGVHIKQLIIKNDLQYIKKLPDNVDVLFLDIEKNQPIEFEFPAKLKELKIEYWFNASIGLLSNSLETLDLGDSYDKKINNILPPNLKHLHLGKRFNHHLYDILPDCLETLIIRNENYMGKISQFPRNLKTLCLSYNKSHVLPDLPHQLENLMLKNKFSQKIKHFPPSIKNLSVGIMYNHEICFLDFQHLKIMDFGFSTYEHDFPEILPDSIEHLFLPLKFNQIIKHLPKNLKSLKLGSLFNKSIDCDLPENLEHIQFSHDYNQSPPVFNENLKTITFGQQFNQPLNQLPNSLLKLKFGGKFNQPIHYLPSKLRTLDFGNDFNEHIEFLPPSLEKLVFRNDYNQPLPILPQNLRELILGDSFNQAIDQLPEKLEVLIFGDNFNGILPKRIPKNLSTLDLGASYDQLVSEKSTTNLKKDSVFEKIWHFLIGVFYLFLNIFQ